MPNCLQGWLFPGGLGRVFLILYLVTQRYSWAVEAAEVGDAAWHQVEYQGKKGYVYSMLIEVSR